MTKVKIVLNSDNTGRLFASGHCDPTVCCAITTLEDALAANLQLYADVLMRDEDDGELLMTWAGPLTRGPVTYTRIALEALAAAHPDDIDLEVTNDY